jgi:glycosyltransferase involved in cell wall biosynthesis
VEVVDHGRTGLLVPAADPASLAGAMADVLVDEQRARAFGEAARCLARQRFSIATQIRHTLDVWSETLAASRA